MEDSFLLRPIQYGYYSYKDLLDGSINLLDIGICNDYINVHLYNKNL